MEKNPALSYANDGKPILYIFNVCLMSNQRSFQITPMRPLLAAEEYYP